MDKKQLQTLLEQVANGGVKPEDALLQIKTEPYKDMGFAKLDTHRGIRQGMAEVIYGEMCIRDSCIYYFAFFLEKTTEKIALQNSGNDT